MKPIATLSRTSSILEAHQLKAKKGYGQNFIIDPTVVQKIAELSQCDQGAVIEIGPGIGALTEQLLQRAVHTTVFEIDPAMVSILKENLSCDQLEIIEGDVLKSNFAQKVKECKEKYGSVVIAANLPYYITTPILFMIFEGNPQPDCITVMMQKEVANRLSAKPKTKEYNALSVVLQTFYTVKAVLHVPKEVFLPRPQVDSTVIQILPKEGILPWNEEQEYIEFVQACFRQKRKTIYNNLREVYGEEDVRDLCKRATIDPGVRAEALDLTTFINLYQIQQKESYERKSLRQD